MNNKIYNKPYTVIRDKKEKSDYWDFPETSFCKGTVWQSMKTGDYTLDGIENIFTIERKGNTGEFAQNITEPRFSRELIRMDQIPQAYLILEFTWDDIETFPHNSGIPSKFWPKLRVGSKFIRKRLIEIMSDYNVQVILAGSRGPEIAQEIFRRMSEVYGEKEFNN